MVLLHISHTLEEFILSFPLSTSINEVCHQATKVHNIRLRLKRIGGSLRLLAKHGPMKPQNERGLTDEQLNFNQSNSNTTNPHADPTGIRIGIPPNHPNLIATLNRCADAIDSICSKERAKSRQTTTMEMLEELFREADGAVKMAYPMGLPHDIIVTQLDDKEDLKGTEDEKYVMDPEKSFLWFAGKIMDRNELLSKYCGNNDKVLLKIKLDSSGENAPQRDHPVDEETRKKLISHWHKKEAESKELQADDEDSYLNSEWANPKQFKQQVYGIGNAIKWKVGGF